jgi:adenylate cyclase
MLLFRNLFAVMPIYAFIQKFIRWESIQDARSQKESFEMRLSLAVLKSERFRLIIIIAIGTVAILQAFGTEYLIPNSTRPLRNVFAGTTFSLVRWGWMMVGAVIYEIIALVFVQKALTTRRLPPEAIRHLSAVVEISFPTLLMITQGQSIHPIYAAHTPIILLYTILIILSTLQLHFALSALTGLLAGAGYFLVCWVSLPIHNGIAPTIENYFYVSPTIAFAKSFLLFASGIIAGLVGMQIRRILIGALIAQEEKNAIVGIFGQYVSPSVAEKLMEKQQEITDDLTGEERDVTIMFLDIRDFTTFSEKRSPQDVVRYLNTIFSHCIAIINDHNGIVNKFLGDGFMAVFGAPFSSGSRSQDAHNAVSAMQSILAMIDKLNADGTIPPTRVGIGLHTGSAVTGSVGSAERKEYTIIGDTVNLASRIEQLTKQLSVRALMSEAVYVQLREEMRIEIHPTALPPTMVKGRNEAVTLYKVQ